jgi:hypothetical protein
LAIVVVVDSEDGVVVAERLGDCEQLQPTSTRHQVELSSNDNGRYRLAVEFWPVLAYLLSLDARLLPHYPTARTTVGL